MIEVKVHDLEIKFSKYEDFEKFLKDRVIKKAINIPSIWTEGTDDIETTTITTNAVDYFIVSSLLTKEGYVEDGFGNKTPFSLTN